MLPEVGTWEEVQKHKLKAFEKFEELKTAMEKHRKELET